MKGVLLTGCAVLAAVLMATGCGSGDEATASLTRAEFVKRGNSICKKSADERGELFAQEAGQYKAGEKISKDVQKDLVVLILATPYREMTAELESLGVPEGDEQEAEKIFKAMEKAADDAESNPAVVFKSTAQFEAANDLVIDYGLTDCIV